MGEVSGLIRFSAPGDLPAIEEGGLCLRFSAGDGERRGISDLPGGDLLERFSTGGDFLTGESSSEEDESLFFGGEAFFPRDGGEPFGLFLLSLAEEFLGCTEEPSFGGARFFFSS